MIATVLLVGMVVTSATVVVFAGSAAISQDREEAEYANARNAMESIGATLNGVSNEGGESTVDLSTLEGGDVSLNESAGRLVIEVADNETGAARDTNTSVITLGRLVYEQGERTVAYQNGGVFESTGDGSNVVSTPPVSYQVESGPATLTFPVIRVTGDATRGQLQADRTSVGRLFETENVDLDPDTNRIDTDVLRQNYTLNLTVSSRYYRAWGAMFSDRLNLTTYYDHSANNVTISLTGDYEDGSTTMACVANCGAGTGSNPNVFGDINAAWYSGGTAAVSNGPVSDSYNSTNGPYSAGTYNGPVRINGSLYFQNSPVYGGDLYVARGMEGWSAGVTTIKGDMVLGEYPSGTPTFSSTGRMTVEENLSFNDTLQNANVDMDIGSDPDKHYMYVGSDVNRLGNVMVNGEMYVDGDVDIDGYSGDLPTTIDGDLVVDGDVTLDSHVTVHGSVTATGTVNKNGAVVDDGTNGGESVGDLGNDIDHGDSLDDVWIEARVPNRPSANELIDNRSAAYDAGNNDNSAFPASGDWRSLYGGTYTVTTGNYTFDGLSVGSTTTLRLDPSSGPINIYVEQLQIQGNAQIEIETYTDRDKRVNFFVENQFQLVNSPRVYTVGTGNPHIASKNWVYLKNGSSISLSNNPEFTGVMYGAGGQGDPGANIYPSNNAEIYGAIVANFGSVSNAPGFHYDEALNNLSADPDGASETGPGAVYRPVYDDSVTASDYDEVVYFESANRTVSVG